MKHQNREAWLAVAIEKMRSDLFMPIGEIVPTVKVSIGFPGGGSARKRIGECWHAKATTDNIAQIFISPTLEKPTRILDVLAHELIHAIVPDAGHKAPFKRIALAIGLTGKMRATIAGPELEKRLNIMADELGELPHAAINLHDGRKKQSTRLIKCECTSCGYVARTTQKWIDTVGAPLCACNNEPMETPSNG